jgi:hypothetical protein
VTKERFVEVDGQGRLLSSDPELDHWFARRRGRWRVVPSPRTLMVFEALPDQAAAPPREQVLLCGTITSRGQLTDVINMLHAGRWQGSFHVLTGEIRKTLMLKDGDIVGAVSTSKSDRLGELLCAHGLITREALNAVLEEVGGPQRLGAALISKGLLTPHQLYSFLNLQVKEIFYSLLLLDEGQFYFKHRDLDEPAWRQLRLNTSSLMLDGMRRVDEMQYFREKIPSTKVVFEKGEIRDLSLEEVDRHILEQIDGNKDLAQVARSLHVTEYDVTRTAFRLLQAGIIRPRAENFLGRRGKAAHEAGLVDVIKLANAVLALVAEEAREVGREAALRQAPTAFHASDTAYNQLFDHVTLLEKGTIDPATLVRNLSALKPPEPVEFLYLAMNEFLSFSVFLVVDGLDSALEQQIRGAVDKLLEETQG